MPAQNLTKQNAESKKQNKSPRILCLSFWKRERERRESERERQCEENSVHFSWQASWSPWHAYKGTLAMKHYLLFNQWALHTCTLTWQMWTTMKAMWSVDLAWSHCDSTLFDKPTGCLCYQKGSNRCLKILYSTLHYNLANICTEGVVICELAQTWPVYGHSLRAVVGYSLLTGCRIGSCESRRDAGSFSDLNSFKNSASVGNFSNFQSS